MYNRIIVLIQFLFSAGNTWVFLLDTDKNQFNAAAAVLCFGLGVAIAILERD